MRRLPLVVFATLAILLTGSAAGVYAYDASRADLVAQGVSAGGVPIGGMRANQARAALERELAQPLERTLQVRAAGREYRLSARRARVSTDVEGMVRSALDRSRAGTVLDRSMRDLRGELVEADVPLRVTYSRRSVTRLVGRVRRAVHRPARNARVQPSAVGLRRVGGRNGRAVRARQLEWRLRAEIVRPRADGLVRATTRVVAPRVTLANLPDRYPAFLTVDRSNYQLRFFRRLELERTYRIAVGQVGLETPAGLYHIQNKAIDPAWQVPDSDWAGDLRGKLIPGGTPENPLKARWMGIYDGAGIHGTDDEGSLGSSASHGCIRMAVPDVRELYDRVEVQTPVFIS